MHTVCKRNPVWIGLAAVAMLLAVLLLLQQLLMPKFMTEIPEGALISEYYRNRGNHDVIFVGDCEAYENVSPITLWESYGIPSYIVGSAQQLIWQSYYLLEEVLRYEKPEIVVFNVLAMQYDEPQSEPYNRMSIDGMRLGLPKIRSARASMMPDESLASYLFPLLRYHGRWQELRGEDFEYLFRRDPKSHNGYLMRVDVKPVKTVPRGRVLADYRFGENSFHYLDKMTRLCRENDIDLVLMKAPSIYPYWYPEWELQMEEYAAQNNLLYLNYLELAEEIGLDYSTDTYDAGLHLNLSGAEKVAVHLGYKLRQRFQLPDRRSDGDLAKEWQNKVNFYYEMKNAQYADLEQYGYLKHFGGRAPETTEE